MSGGRKSEFKVLRGPCSLWRLWERILPLPAYGISRCSLACGHITPISLSSHGLLCASSPFLFLVRTLVIGFSPHSQVALVVKNPPANAGDATGVGSIPRSGRSPGEGHGNPLQYSCLENPMDRGAWQAIVLMVPKSWTLLKRLSTAQHKGNPELNYIFIDPFFFFFFANKGTVTVFRMWIYLLGCHHSAHYRPWLLRHLTHQNAFFFIYFSPF